MSKFIPILRTGRYKDASGRVYDITPQMLQEIKDSYKSKSAPLVKGHPNADAPSMGWIDQLKLKGEELLASFSDIADSFKEEVAQSAFGCTNFFKSHPHLSVFPVDRYFETKNHHRNMVVLLVP
ncbi:MAG: hypothetical protein ACRCS8_00025 [Brevinema sp.]